MKLPLSILASVVVCTAQITGVTEIPTATQVRVAYTAPDTNPCTVELSTSNTLSPLVHDVDPNIFTGYDTDTTRPSSIINGRLRIVVLGQRASTLATAGTYSGLRHYSHALQANTQHWGRIACTASTATFTVTTLNIPLGQTYPDPWLSDGAGNQPWPETPGATTTESFVDPLTGVLLQRVMPRGNGYGYWPSMPFSTARNQGQAPCSNTGGWTSPCNAMLTGGSYATIGNSTNWLVLRNAMVTGNAWGGYNGSTSSYATCCQIDQLQFNMTAYTPGCSGDTCKFDACVSMDDGHSCAGAIQTVTFGTTPSTGAFGSASTSQFGATSWAFDTSPRFNVEESTPHQGKATVAGTTLTWASDCSGPSSALNGGINSSVPSIIVTSASTVQHNGDVITIDSEQMSVTAGAGTLSLTVVRGVGGTTPASHLNGATVTDSGCTSASFSLYWLNSSIRISPTSVVQACAPPPTVNDSTEYTVSSFIDGDNLTLSSAPGNGTVYFCAQPFSIMVRRHAADSNTASIQNVNMGALEGAFPVFPSNGANTAVYGTQVGGGWFVMYGGLSWINTSTTEIRYYGVPYLPAGPTANPWLSSRGCPGVNAAFFDQAAAQPTWYCLTTESGEYVMVRGRLMGGGGVPPAYTQPYSDLAFESGCVTTDDYTITCNAGGGVSMVWDILTPHSLSQDINAQLASFDSGIAAKVAAWGSTPSTSQQVTEKSVFYFSIFSTGAQDSPGIVLAINPGDGVPAHAGMAGGPALIGAVTSFNTGPAVSTPTVLPAVTQAYGRTLHSVVETGGTGYVAMGMNNSSYETVNTSHTSIPPTSGTCFSLSVPGFGSGDPSQCIQIQIDSYTHASVTGYDPYLTNTGINGSNLAAPFTGAPGELRAAQIGDLACIDYANATSPLASSQCAYQGAEMMMLVQNPGSGLWTFERKMYGFEQARDSGAQVALWWSAFETALPYQSNSTVLQPYWNPLAGCAGSTPDPHGNCMIQDTNENGAHEFVRDGSATGATNIPSWITLGQWPFGYRSVAGSVPTSISAPWANNVPNAQPLVHMVHGNPAFAGATGGAWSGEASTHPNPPASQVPAEQTHAFDAVTFSGAAFTGWDPVFVNVSGQLYDLAAPLTVTDPDDVGYFHRKLLPTASSCGNHPLTDVSGPSSNIDGTAGSSYQYCLPRANGECVGGSVVGQVYVNCPGLLQTSGAYTCNGSGLHGSAQLGVGNDVCIHNASPTLNVLSQFEIDQTDQYGSGRRTMVSDIGRIRMSAGFDNARLLPVNTGMLVENWWSDLQTSSLWLAKMMPTPASSCVLYNRNTFIPMPMTLTPPSGMGITSAVIRFGYAEYGAPSHYYCTSRADECISNTTAVPGGTQPFSFDSESPSGLSCSTSCVITVPGISQRMVYTLTQFLAGSTVVSSNQQVMVVP